MAVVAVDFQPLQVCSHFATSLRKQSRQNDVHIIPGRPRLPVPGSEQEEAAGGAYAAVRRQEELLDSRPEGRLSQGGDHQYEGRRRHRTD